MKKLVLCISFIFMISCATDTPKTKNKITSITSKDLWYENSINTFIGPINLVKPYELKLQLNELKSNNYDLEIQILLYNNSHFISPNAKRDFSGKFTVFIENNNNFKLKGKLIETPLSIEENDPHPFTNGLVNWVHVNTTYNQELQVTSQNNFQVFGFIQFTIEPRCSLEKIPFIIISENGKLKLELDNC